MMFLSSDDINTILGRNKAFQNLHCEERGFILGTGPSIKKQNLKILAGEISIGVSNFFVHPDYDIIKPRYYCVASYHPPITEEAWQEWMKAMAAKTGDASMFFSLNDIVRIKYGGYFTNRNVQYLLFGNQEEVIQATLSQGVDLGSIVMGPQSVSIMALMVAIYLGFKEIYLLGCDHDWLCHIHESKHFYDEKEHVMVQRGYNEWQDSNIEGECQALLNLWRQYKILQYAASMRGIQIYNATEGGWLDVFPRVLLK